MEQLLEMGRASGFNAVEVFRESVSEIDWQEGPAGLQKHQSFRDRVAVRSFWEQGDPVFFVLGKPEWRAARKAFSQVSTALLPQPGIGYSGLLPKKTDFIQLRICDPQVNADERKQAALLRESTAETLASFPGLKLIALHFNRQFRKVQLVNSHGFNGKYKKSLFTLRLVFTRQDRIIEVSENTIFFNQINPVNMVARAHNLIGSLTENPAPEKGCENLILAPEAAAGMLADCSSLFHSHAVSDRIMAAPVLSVSDHPGLPDRPGSVPFDDEGVGAREKILINKGVFSGAINDLEGAFVCNATLSGNGFRDCRTLYPRPFFSNLIIKPSAYSLSKLIGESGRGILVTGMRKKNDIIADNAYRYSVYGYLFRDNDFAEAVHFYLRTTPSSFLNSVQMVSKEIKFFKKGFIVGAPYVLCLSRRRRDGSFSF